MNQSKYKKLWEYLQRQNISPLILSFAEIEQISGFEINHSFLNAKKELTEFSWQVKKISLKEKTICFIKLN